ncbi:hypothetical protein ACJRO7_034277 [Eucalyptus globulus]|uniref:Uncharacterized protein n=1 Tax=Eucalyptus globulus TaxID=34317 RepID=A0ABD3J5V8_EUCGL
MAIILFSPSGKPFSFGHPSVGAVLDRFEHPQAVCPTVTQQAKTKGGTLVELNKQYADVLERLEAEKKWAKEQLDKRGMELLGLEASTSTPHAGAIDASVISQIAMILVEQMLVRSSQF